jgi:hypothetical protein
MWVSRIDKSYYTWLMIYEELNHNKLMFQSEGTTSLRPFSHWTNSLYRLSENALRDLLFYKHKDIHNSIWKHDEMSSQKSLTYDFPPDMNFNHFFSWFIHLYFDSIKPTRIMWLWLRRRIILSHPLMLRWHLIRLMENVFLYSDW